jgi:hypothetical protein
MLYSEVDLVKTQDVSSEALKQVAVVPDDHELSRTRTHGSTSRPVTGIDRLKAIVAQLQASAVLHLMLLGVDAYMVRSSSV